jgi:hypothetical protein
LQNQRDIFVKLQNQHPKKNTNYDTKRNKPKAFPVVIKDLFETEGMDLKLFCRISNANLHSRPFTTEKIKNGWTVDIIVETAYVFAVVC